MPDQLERGVRRRLCAAERAVESGRAAASLAHFDAALAADPSCAYGLFFRAGVRLVLGQSAGAERDWRALEALPVSCFVRYREFEVPSPRVYPSFLGGLERLLRRRPCAFALAAKAFALRAQGRFDDSVAAMEASARLAPRNAGLRAFLARLRFVYRFPEEGLRDLREAAALEPRCGWIQGWLAEALRHRGKPAESLRRAERAVALDPSYFRSYAWRGAALRLLGRPRPAIADFGRALTLDERQSRGWEGGAVGRDADRNRSWIFNERMLAKRRIGDLEGALEDLNEAHGLNNRYGWIFSPRRDEASYRAAASELDSFLRRHPDHGWARAWRGWTKLESGFCAEALEDLRRVRPLGKRGAWVLTWRARARAGLGEAAAALADLDSAVLLDPCYAPAAAWRGGLLRAAGRLEPARRELDRALELDPVCAWAMAWRGELSLSQGRPRPALQDLDAALLLDPENADSYFWRAEAHRRLGERGSARRDARACRRLRPRDWKAWALLSLLSREEGEQAGERRALRLALRLAPPELRRQAEAASGAQGGLARSARRA